MPRILLVTNAAHDTATNYLDSWSEKILRIAKKQKNIKILKLGGEEASKEGVTKLIETERPQLVIFNGHGDANSIRGYKFSVLIQSNDNEKLLDKKLIHAFACSAGKTLGPRCIKIGSEVYIGYSEDFKLTHLNRLTKDEQIKDQIAQLFLEPAFSAITALIEGKTALEAYEISQEQYSKNLRFLITSDDTELNTTVAARLFHNLVYQVRLGNRTASF